MSSLGPNAQKRYYPANSNASSTTNLLPPPGPRGPSPQGVQPALARGPQLKNMASNSSLVRHLAAITLITYSDRASPTERVPLQYRSGCKQDFVYRSLHL